MVLIPFLVFLACLFITYALFLITSRNSDARRTRLNERLAEAIRSSAHSNDVEVQLAREELLSEIPWMNRTLVKLEISSRVKRMIDQADLQITVLLTDGWRTRFSCRISAEHLLPDDGPLWSDRYGAALCLHRQVA